MPGIIRLMSAAKTISALAGFERRGAGSDAERRASLWLARELGALGREPRIEPFWCRPNWAAAHAWHAALGLAGSLVAVGSPRIGGALILIALLSVIADAFTGRSLGRRLTPERASQNVVAPAPDGEGSGQVRLVITANYDAGLTGLAYRTPLRSAAARLRSAAGPLAPGWLGWLSISLVWLLVIAVLRLQGSHGPAVGAAQLPPTVFLVLALALLLELATAERSPAAADNGSGSAAAVALARALDVAPPRSLAVEVVLEGAGEGPGIGLRRYLRARRRELVPANTIVVGIAACGAGNPRWWISDGALLPLGHLGRLREMCALVAADEPHLSARGHRGRGSAPGLPARLARLPSITIGALDDRGLAPRSHQSSDTPGSVDPAAIDRTVHFGLLLVDAIDEFVASAAAPEPALATST
jgi:hypothetical protein